MTSTYTISKSKIFSKLKSLDFYNIFLNLTLCLLIVAIILLISHPSKYMDSIMAGLELFFYSVFPSLLPFLFLSKLLDGLGLFQKLNKLIAPATKKIFKVPSIATYPFLMSLISGYPLGAKIIGELSREKLLSETDAKKIISLASTSGPIFVIGSVGAGMLKNVKLGALIFAVHILGSLVTAFIFTRKRPARPKAQQVFQTNFSQNLLSSTTSSTINSILTVAVYISIFYMFIDMAYDLQILKFGTIIFEKLLTILSINTKFAFGLSSGIVEMTRGVKEIAKIGNDFYSLVFMSGLISFGGLSIILQSLTFLSGTKIKPLYFIFMKTVQAVVTIIIAIPVGILFI